MYSRNLSIIANKNFKYGSAATNLTRRFGLLSTTASSSLSLASNFSSFNSYQQTRWASTTASSTMPSATENEAAKAHEQKPAAPAPTGRTIKIGDVATASVTFTADKIKEFASIVGDVNPIHLCKEEALKAGFTDVVVHGTLSIGVISNVLGTNMPGPKSVYLQQKTEFVAPVYAGEEVTAVVTVKEFEKRKGLIWLDTTVTKKPKVAEGDSTAPPPAPVVVIRGFALVMNKSVVFEGESEWTFKR